MKPKLHILITGGTIDSYFSTLQDQVVVADRSSIREYFEEVAHAQIDLSYEMLTMKDSRSITASTREDILHSIMKTPKQQILITHGTYTMAQTAQFLKQHQDQFAEKTVVLTGSMLPLRGFSPTDAPFNLGFAMASAQLAAPGVYVAMNAQLFDADNVEKKVDLGVFMARKEYDLHQYK